MTARVHLCGRLRVEWDGERIDQAFPGRQGRLLFAYLTLHRDRPVRRDELIEALWPGTSAEDALLRPPLSRLRSALGEGRLEGRGELAIRFPQDTWIDFEAVREGLRASRAERDPRAGWDAARPALALAELGLLPGLEGSWFEPFRAELEEHRIELLETLALAGARLGPAEQAEAEQAARRAVEAAPFRESARVALLEVLRRRGNVAEALLAFEEIRIVLRDELGTAPGRELLALHAELLRGEPAPAAGGPLPDRLAQALASRWVGRTEALATLRERAGRAAAGATELLLVAGEGGIGKTRLVAELAAGLDGFDVRYGRCDEEEVAPYGPWVEMLGELDAATLGDFASQAGGDAATERRLLFAAVARAVGELARARPLLLVVDDLHWADRSSLLLARHLARQPDLGGVLMIGTFRDTELDPGHPLPGLIADVERDRPVARLRLTGMDEQEVAELVGGADVRRIHAETEGNPFFAAQLARHFAEGGDDLPESVRDVIARRVARLPGEAAPALRVGALIGRDFDLDLLMRASDLGPDVLLDVLDAAVHGALLTEVPSAPGRYSFTHALVRSALEAELTATRRAVLHRRIGEVIEQAHRDDVEPWLGELARHFAEAGPQESERAVDYAVRAAARATARLAFDEAVELLARAVALRRHEDAADGLELSQLETALATAQSGAGRWEAARASFARASEAARGAAAGAAFARAALGHSGATWEHFGQHEPASIALLEEALERLPGGDSRLRAQVLARLSVLRYYEPTASWDEVLGAADEAVAIARRLADADALVPALGAAQHARWRLGLAEERLPIAKELVALATERGTPGEAAEAHLWSSLALFELCRRDEADVHVERFAALAEATQQHQLLVLRNAQLGAQRLNDGDYAGALALADELREWRRRSEVQGGMAVAVHWGYEALMLVLLSERDALGQLTDDLERAVHEMRGVPGWEVTLAWAHVQAGRTERGREELTALSEDDFAVLPRDVNFVPALIMAANAVRQLRDATLAARIEPLLAPYREYWAVVGIGVSTLGPVALAVGWMQLVQGDVDSAAGSFELALARSEQMRSRPYAAWSQAGRAAALRVRGDTARAEELSALADAEARALGMTRLLRELVA